MESTTRTILGANLQTHLVLNKQLVIQEHTTLNEKFNVAVDAILQPKENPAIKYVTIGNGAHTVGVDPDGFAYVKSYLHKPSDMALFNHIPFVCREIDNDLNEAERLKYRIRVLTYIKGIPYVLYYAKVLDMSESDPIMSRNTVIDGITTTLDFTPTLDNLSPIPSELVEEGINTTTGDYLSTLSICKLTLTPEEVQEIITACTILYGNQRYAIISELGVCSGIDKTVPGNFNGTSLNYTEVAACQLFAISSCFYQMNQSQEGISIYINVGAVEPLLV